MLRRFGHNSVWVFVVVLILEDIKSLSCVNFRRVSIVAISTDCRARATLEFEIFPRVIEKRDRARVEFQIYTKMCAVGKGEEMMFGFWWRMFKNLEFYMYNAMSSNIWILLLYVFLNRIFPKETYQKIIHYLVYSHCH